MFVAKPNIFVNNPLSLTLLKENTVSSLVQMRSNESNKCAVANFYDALIDPEYSHSLEARRSAWAWGIRHEIPNGTMFDYFHAHVRFDVPSGRYLLKMVLTARYKRGKATIANTIPANRDWRHSNSNVLWEAWLRSLAWKA